ncbi:MAG: pantetheine-phosphate adenylyltransferase [Planctomycetota bacterium]|jgi:pantetheine-phosphate adenylyltransferase
MPTRAAVFPGSFDPITSGHLDVIRRGSKLFAKLIIGVARNPGKSSPLFSVEERIESIEKLVHDIDNVEVVAFDGMTVDFVKETGADAILRGIRTFSDFEYEFQLALANRAFAEVETVFVMASEENSFVRSTLIKEAASMGADVSRFVPAEIAEKMKERLKSDDSTAGLRGDEA